MSITSVVEYISAIKKISKSLQDTKLNHLWFRAENNSYNTKLIPSLYRDQKITPNYVAFYQFNNEQSDLLHRIEHQIKSKFNINKPVNGNFKIEYNAWETYYLMQHYGVSTRLLDWTESALIALFFCVENLNIGNLDEGDKYDGIVWVLNPYKLNQLNVCFVENQLKNNQPGYDLTNKDHSFIFVPRNVKNKKVLDKNGNLKLNKLLKCYLDLDFQECTRYDPIAITPQRFDTRLKSQKSNFTIFGNIPNGLISNCHKDKYLDKILIKRESFEEIKNELNVLGINYESIYPGLEGISKDVMNDIHRLL